MQAALKDDLVLALIVDLLSAPQMSYRMNKCLMDQRNMQQEDFHPTELRSALHRIDLEIRPWARIGKPSANRATLLAVSWPGTEMAMMAMMMNIIDMYSALVSRLVKIPQSTSAFLPSPA